MVRSFNNSPKCMIKIFLESDKFSHKAGVTKHATNSLARKSHQKYIQPYLHKVFAWTLPMATHPKVLGLTLDPKLTYSTHIHNISVQAHKPLQIMKALTATGWGKQKETLMATYKAVMRPTLEYASSV